MFKKIDIYFYNKKGGDLMRSPYQELKPGMYYDLDSLISRFGKEVVEMLQSNYELEESPHKLSMGIYRYKPKSNLLTKLFWGW